MRTTGSGTTPGQPTDPGRRAVGLVAHLGRSAPRSRLGCTTCKRRRVRCDETRPLCGHCERLQLHCHYKPRSQRYRLDDVRADDTRDVNPESGEDAQHAQALSEAQPLVAEVNGTVASSGDGASGRRGNTSPSVQIGQPWNGFGAIPRSGYATPDGYNNGVPPWTLARTVDFNDIFSELGTSWAGDPFSEHIPVNALDATSTYIAARTQTDIIPATTPTAVASPVVITQPKSVDRTPSISHHDYPSSAPHLLHLFKRIQQPPAAILIGGVERWHRLQKYLCKLSENSRAVNSSLLCIIELLMIDEPSQQAQSRESCMVRILERHGIACREIQRKLAKNGDMSSKSRECLLAAVFLLGWFEVIRDQDLQASLFPRRLAESVITGHTSWNRYSQQLLSWLNTLDSKATHLGREHLLTPESLHVVSCYHTEITSSLQNDWHDKDSDSDQSPSDTSPGDSSFSPIDAVVSSPSLGLGQVKQAMLHTILQPALGWYLTSQSYCRRISAHDKHHRRRFTTDAEFEVITACKQLETELFELWEYRPVVLTMPIEQLMAVVAPDIAQRLEEIFSTYLASFWILFVYLHRVSWWHLPHSPLARRALFEVWQHMQRAYGEEVAGPLRRVIHPSLLWPLFLFGSECQDEQQRTWAVEQLDALGDAKTIVETDGTSETLPPFRLSLGATRNASRAAVLLRELIKQQDLKGVRVDDRELSMAMFGCYFSIV